jgi:protein TonB
VVGKEPEPSPPEQKPAEKEPPPDIPKAKTEIQKAVTPAKRTKKDSTSVVAVHPRQIENRPADSRKIDSDTQDHPLENAPVSSGEGQRNGAGNGAAAGEGSAGPGRGLGNGSAGEFDAASVDRAPQILKKVDPVYPPTARSLGVSGKVVVRFLVGPDGSVSKPSIIEAQPKGYFEESTLEALRRWHFKPGNFKGKDVATWVILPVQFRLSGHN